MEQLQNGLAVKDLLESLLLWQSGQGSEDDLRLMVRQALHQRLPEYQVDMLEEGGLPESVLRAIAEDLAKNLSTESEKISALSFKDSTRPDRSSLPKHSVLEIELLPDPEVPPPEELARRRWDPISLYYGLDGLIRFLTWDLLSLPGMVVVACIIAVASLPFTLENPEFSKDGSPLLPFGKSRPRPSQYALPADESQAASERSMFPDTTAPSRTEVVAGSEQSSTKVTADGVEFTPEIPTASTSEERQVDGVAKLSPPEDSVSGEEPKEEELDLDSLLAPILTEADNQEDNSDQPEKDARDTNSRAKDDGQNFESKLGAAVNMVPKSEQDLQLVVVEPRDIQLPSPSHMAEPTKPEPGQDTTAASSLPTSQPASAVRPEPSARSESTLRPESASKPTPELVQEFDDGDGATKDVADEVLVAKGIPTAAMPHEPPALTAESLLTMLKQDQLDQAIEQLEYQSGSDIDPMVIRHLQIEALIRGNSPVSREIAWSLLAESQSSSQVDDLLCARLLLNASPNEREEFAENSQSSPRYSAWLGSWRAKTDLMARTRLQRSMFQNPSTSYLDSIFMANANFALGDLNAAHDGLVAAKDRLLTKKLESESPLSQWLIEQSVEALQLRLGKTIQILSRRITKTAAH